MAHAWNAHYTELMRDHERVRGTVFDPARIPSAEYEAMRQATTDEGLRASCPWAAWWFRRQRWLDAQ